MRATVLISGTGQLGSRYLQGLVKCRLPLRIYVQDVFEDALVRAEQRWIEAGGEKCEHELSFVTSVEELPKQAEIAIVATTADVRPDLICKIAHHADVRFWVLEKVLAQSEQGLDEIVTHVESGDGAWVNTPRRMIPWHKQIKSQLGLGRPLMLRFEGGLWGLACNAVHYLDLLAWLTDEALEDINTESLDSAWFESKRPGNWEISGTLEATFSRGSRAILSAREGQDLAPLQLSDGTLSWSINEVGGKAERSDGIKVPGRMSYQSEMSAELVERIIESESCDLPTLDESVALHRIFLRRMLEHWKQAGHPASTIVPIT